MTRIEERLRESIGLDAASVGASLIHRAVRRRMRSLGLKRIEDYWKVLERSTAEWHGLVESVVITETWFFREQESIASFVRLAQEEWLPAHSTGFLRLLSVPCSSGEEPFSLVMALLSAGVPADRFQVDAVDISSDALARAARGIYGRNSFRGKELAFRGRYFEHCKDGYLLNQDVRNCVHFFHGNILGEGFPSSRAGYDFIFCRNLLIYFDLPTRRKALEKLERLLAPGGVVFVGAAEQPLATSHGLVTAASQMPFACRPAGQRAPLPQPDGALRQNAAAPRGLVGSEAALKLRGDPSNPLPGAPPASGGSDLEAARCLAEAGHLQQAMEICEAHLRESWASAQAHYLLGLMREASGEPGAMDCYRKALYLEPNHYESLLQMAVLLQKNGDAARARAFKRRAQRSRMKP